MLSQEEREDSPDGDDQDDDGPGLKREVDSLDDESVDQKGDREYASSKDGANSEDERDADDDEEPTTKVAAVGAKTKGRGRGGKGQQRDSAAAAEATGRVAGAVIRFLVGKQAANCKCGMCSKTAKALSEKHSAPLPMLVILRFGLALN